MLKYLRIAALFALLAPAALAGEPYQAINGFAASGYDVVAYFSLPQVAANEPPPPAVPGRETITVEYQGGTYAFDSIMNRDAFLEDPEQYLPAFDGHCAFGTSVGVKASGNPLLWRIDNGRLYFNGNQFVFDRFRSDIPAFMTQADGNWPVLEPRPASLDILQDFDPFAAPLMD